MFRMPVLVGSGCRRQHGSHQRAPSLRLYWLWSLFAISPSSCSSSPPLPRAPRSRPAQPAQPCYPLFSSPLPSFFLSPQSRSAPAACTGSSHATSPIRSSSRAPSSSKQTATTRPTVQPTRPALAAAAAATTTPSATPRTRPFLLNVAGAPSVPTRRVGARNSSLSGVRASSTATVSMRICFVLCGGRCPGGCDRSDAGT